MSDPGRKLIAQKLASGPCWTRSLQRMSDTLAAMIEADEVVRVKPHGGAAKNMVALTTIGAKRYGIERRYFDFETPMSQRTDDLAEKVAGGVGVTEAGRRLGMSPEMTRDLWSKIKAGLGWQAV